ncbi:MAG TPA: hemerythrin domain-containing protein [Gaiellaceae bacterium]|nr:hemerythrin domain-containing protein [Gaiellaceae bacterium]
MARTLTEPLRARHDDLRPRIDQIGSVARLVPELDPAARVAAVHPVLAFLRGDLWRHAEAEERWLYPEVAHRLRHPMATATMKLDHTILREWVDELAADDGRDADSLQATLYGIQSLLQAHLRKEEELYLPQLENEQDRETVAAIREAMARHEAGEPDQTAVEDLDFERKEYPFSGSEVARLVFLLRYAVLAPSSHNSQPWCIRPDADALLVYADRTRALPVVDPDDRELEISCGAFLHHLRIGIRQHGHEGDFSLLPDSADADLLARVRLGPDRGPSYDERLLFWAIAKRHTNRRPFLPKTVPDELVRELVAAAEAEGAWLVRLEDDDRQALASLVAAADRAQMLDPAFRRELEAWVHGDRERTGDGMPAYDSRKSRLRATLSPLAMRTFDLGKGKAAHDEKLIEASPLLVVLGTAGDTTSERLAAGQALSRLLLRATQEGLAASFLNQPLEVSDLGPKVAELTGRAGVPQLVLRLGYGPEARPTPRRPVRDLVVG